MIILLQLTISFQNKEVANIKNFFRVIILILSSLLLSSCWDKKELNELAIVFALGVDKVEDGYEISAQVVNPDILASKNANSTRSPVVTFHGKGDSIYEAIRKMTTLTPRKLHFSHMQLVVFGEELASQGISETIDLLARDREVREDFNFVVSRNSNAGEILEVLTPIEKIPASKIINSLNASIKAWGSTASVNIDDITSTLKSSQKNLVLSAIEIYGDRELGKELTNLESIDVPTILKLEGLAVFKKDQLIGYLTEEESKGFNYLSDKIETTIETISCPKEGKLSTEVIRAQTKTKGNFENGTPKIKVHINVEQNVREVKCSLNLTEEKNLKYINKKTADLIKTRIEDTLTIAQENFQSDIFGFGDVLYREDLNQWKKIKDDWLSIFPKLDVKVEVDVRTIGIGSLTN